MKNLLILLSLIIPAFAFSPASTQTVSIAITNLENNKGNVQLGVFTNQKDFKADKPIKLLKFSKSKMKDGKLTVSVSLAPGTYGIALLDDENKNGEMDWGWVMPDEGFGFSNYYHTGMSRPTFDQFKFKVGNSDMSVKVKVRYL